jgi:hypothetical protein
MKLRIPEWGNGAERWVQVFILFYFAFLVLLAFYVENLGNAMRVDPVRLYSVDTMWRLMVVQCAPADPGLFNYVNPSPFYLLLAAPASQLLQAGGISPITSIRLFNTFLSLVTLLATSGVLRRLNIGPGFTLLALAVIASNPLYLVYSISTIETMALVALVMAGVYFLYRQNFLISAVLVSLSPLVRVEGYPIAAVWMLYYLFRFRRGSLHYLIAAALPHLFYYFFISVLVFGDPFHHLHFRAGVREIETTYFTHPWNLATPMENFSKFVPPLIGLHGYLFFALASAAFFTTLRKRQFIPVNIVVGAVLLFLAGVLLFFEELSDRWALIVVVASAIPLAHLLQRLSATGRRATAIVATLALGMVVMNASNLGAQAPGECCPSLRTYSPQQTMDWVKNYTETQGENRVYVDWSQNLVRLPLQDRECTLIRKDVKTLLGPGANCTFLVVTPARVEYRLGFEREGVILTNRDLRCTPPDTEFHRVTTLAEDSVNIYRIEKVKSPVPESVVP